MSGGGGKHGLSPARRALEEATALIDNGQHAAAIKPLEVLLARRPQLADAHYQLGRAQHASGRAEPARACFQQAVVHDPKHARAWYRLGNDEATRECWQAALAHYDQALALEPGWAVVHFNRGVALRKLGRDEEALASYDRALALDPTHAEAHCNRANLLMLREGRDEEAMAHFNAALQLNPRLLVAQLGRAGLLAKRHEYEPALAAVQPLVTREPGNADARFVLGRALRGLGRVEPALTVLREAEALGCAHVDLASEIGLTLVDCGRLDEADAHYCALLSHTAPEFQPVIEVFLGLLRLTRGDYAGGWPLYEARRRYPRERQRMTARALPDRPEWRGTTPLAGQTLLVLDEQGIGDGLQFWRLLPLLTAAGATVLAEVRPALRALFEPPPPGVTLLAEGGPYPAFDAYCALLSLPLALGMRVETIPAAVPYVQVPAARQLRMLERLGPRTSRPRVGLAWSGNPAHDLDHRRSLPLSSLEPLLELDCEFHVIQNDVRARDQATLAAHPEVRQHQDALSDFADTAALVEALDLVISVDTSLAHLAGALGKSVWVLVTSPPDFRWLLDRSDSPWYPSARIFRQPAPLDWASVLRELRDALADWRREHEVDCLLQTNK